jgi:hypothetical protein
MGVAGKDPMASKHDGYTGYGYIVTVAESPKLPGVIWVGTDDGNCQVSKDGGATWTNVAKNVPVSARRITSRASSLRTSTRALAISPSTGIVPTI